MTHERELIYVTLCLMLAGAMALAAQEGEQVPAGTSQFLGAWRNDNPDTKGVTRFEIEDRGKRITVHAWGACRPNDCDWGTAEGRVKRGAAEIMWEQSFAERHMTLVPDGDRLRMALDIVYKDRRKPKQEVEYFVRSR